MTWLLCAIALVLIAFGGLFAACETALLTLPKTEIAEVAVRPGTPNSLAKVAAEPATYAATSGMMRLVSQSTATVCVTIVALNVVPLRWVAGLIAVACMALVSVILVGVSPMNVGRRVPERVLPIGARILVPSRVVLAPFVNRIARRRSQQRADSDDEESERRLLHLIDRANEDLIVEDEEREFMHSVVEFGETRIRSISVPRTEMITVDSDATLDEAVATFLSQGVSRVPVIGEDSDEILGVLYLRDATRALFDAPERAHEIRVITLIRPAQYVPEMLEADEMLRRMRIESNHMALLIDEYGGVSGLITMEDLIEELVGDISDEYDKADRDVTELGTDRYRVAARLELDELSDLFDVDIEDEDVDTVGGLLMKTLGHLPKPGESVTRDGVHLTVEHVEARTERILTVIAEATDELKAVHTAVEHMVNDRETNGERQLD